MSNEETSLSVNSKVQSWIRRDMTFGQVLKRHGLSMEDFRDWVETPRGRRKLLSRNKVEAFKRMARLFRVFTWEGKTIDQRGRR